MKEKKMAAQPSTTVVSKDVDRKYVSIITDFFNRMGVSGSIPEDYFSKDFYSNIISGNLKVDKIERGHVTCHLTVHPVIAVILRNSLFYPRFNVYIYFLILFTPDRVVL